MVKRFYSAPGLANTVWLFVIGLCLMLVPAVMSGFWERIFNFLIVVIPLLIIFWAGAKYGTYIEVDIEKKIVGGKGLFIPSKEISLSDVVELEISGSFAGVITQIYMICKHKNGKLVERGLGSKEAFAKQDLKDLILTIHQINPSIKIPEELLK